MKIDFPCAMHSDARALQISKCTAHHQLCGPCWTEANKSGHCPCCQEVLKELMPEPICEYRIGQYKLATKFDFRHRLPLELLDEIIKFCPVEHFPRAASFCRPKNMALLMANSALNTLATNQLKLKKDFYFKITLTTLLTKTRTRIRDGIWRSTLSKQEIVEIATKMLRNKGTYIYREELRGVEIIREDNQHLKDRLWDIGIVKSEIEVEMKAMNIIDKKYKGTLQIFI